MELLLELIMPILTQSYENGNIIILMVVFIGIIVSSLIANAKKLIKISELYESRKRLRIERLKDALGSEYVKCLTRIHLENEIEAEYFKLATGVYCERDFREEIIKLQQSSKGYLVFWHFKQAFPHLRYEDGHVMVNIYMSEHVSFWVNYVIGWISALTGLIGFIVLMLLILPVNGLTPIQILILSGVFVFLILLALFLFSQTLPVRSAKRINKHIMKLS